MQSWNPHEYLRFSGDRTRPSVDLAWRIAVEHPDTVIDLGCGPGNSTRILRERWPDARVVGLDSSASMIEAARAEEPDAEWLLSRIEDWAPEAPLDVVFSNAALQWIHGNDLLVERLFRSVAEGGALGFQIPSTTYATVHTLIHEIALEGPWAPRMAGPLGALTMERPGVYYDSLITAARSVDLWETEYFHVMDSPAAIVDWISSTGLRPFLDALDAEDEKRDFLELLHERVAAAYRPQRDGRVLFPFRRTFVVAYK